MSLTIDEALHQISLKTLADLSTHELQRRRWDEPGGDRYCVELFRRALVEEADEAWSALQQCFTETVRSGLGSHASHDVALLRDSEENDIARTFSRFWYAVRDQQLEFTTLPAALRYLHATLNGLLMDTLRSHLRGRAREVPLPEPGCSEEPATANAIDGQSIWDDIQGFLPDERERRVAYLLYYCGLKPRDIIVRCSHEFKDVQEIYHLNHNVVKRLRRNRERLVTTREEERRRLRRDLHDGLGPTLAALNLQAGVVRKLITSDPVAADALVTEWRTELRVAIADIRRLVYELRPPALDELGLVGAIRERATQYQHSGDTDRLSLRVIVEAPEHMPSLPPAIEVAAYRIVQEALTNMLRHAQART